MTKKIGYFGPICRLQCNCARDCRFGIKA